jgi:hypothetical protein
VRRHQAESPHEVRGRDFKFDATADGRRLKFVNVINKHSRLCVAIRVGRRCRAKDVVAVLEELTSLCQPPACFRYNNEPEFIHYALKRWSAKATPQLPKFSQYPHARTACRRVEQPVVKRIPDHNAICHGGKGPSIG